MPPFPTATPLPRTLRTIIAIKMPVRPCSRDPNFKKWSWQTQLPHGKCLHYVRGCQPKRKPGWLMGVRGTLLDMAHFRPLEKSCLSRDYFTDLKGNIFYSDPWERVRRGRGTRQQYA